MMIIAISIILLFITIILFINISTDAYAFRLFSLGFLFRIIVMYLDCYEIVGIPGNGDEWQFNNDAIESLTTNEYTHLTNYTVFLSVVYGYTNCSRLIAQYINVLMGMAFLVYLNKTLKIVNVENVIRKQILVISTLMPNLIFFAAILLREAWIEMFLMMSIYHYVKWFLKDGKSYHMVISIIFVFCSTWMHSGCIMVAMGYILSFLIYDRNSKKIHLSESFIPVSFFIVVAISIVVLNSGALMSKFWNIGNMAAEDMMVDIYSVKVEAGSTYLDWLNVTTPLQAMLFAPLKMFYFLFSPIPLDWRSIMDIIAFFLDSTVYIFLLYRIYKNKSYKKEHKYLIRFLLISFFIATFVFAFGTIASGTAVRHRAKLIALLFVCYGLTKVRDLKYENSILQQ